MIIQSCLVYETQQADFIIIKIWQHFKNLIIFFENNILIRYCFNRGLPNAFRISFFLTFSSFHRVHLVQTFLRPLGQTQLFALVFLAITAFDKQFRASTNWSFHYIQVNEPKQTTNYCQKIHISFIDNLTKRCWVSKLAKIGCRHLWTTL